MTCMFSLFRKRRKSDPSSTDTPRSERQSGSMSTQATSRRHDVDQLTKDMARATISSVQTVPLANSAFIGGFNPALGNSLPSVPQTQSGQSGRNGVLPASHSSHATPTWTLAHTPADGHSTNIEDYAVRTNPGAFTKAGARCSRVVKQPVSLDAVDPDVEPKQERFCHQHLKEQLKHTQFPLKGDIWVDFADWIPSYLHPNTQAALRKEMQRVISAADEPGYIYVYQYRDLHGPDYLCFKVGRTVTLNKRLGEWEKQCGSRVPHLRHWAPSSVDERDQGIVGGGVKQGKPAAWCHRLERLIHLELADQLRYAPYLDPKYPNIEGERKLAEIPKKAPCSDCQHHCPSLRRRLNLTVLTGGKMHREIFPLPRAPDGPFKDRELENIVIPVVDKWTQFMGIYGDAFNIQEKQLTDGQ
ncbi:predicted protein [Postia placenta Mad-698-R]|uniref:GIY-YIG domain-containing protein n=1 Tax=Postia placenta MAD-698-R-SB12 TaxID=670580 RepID=A0A1X6N8H2_9APHY|nr:hypothetical protein POSPLADRAFT_1044259 [Postia placenta MAD-698-R-SB12]EED79500.1 predicted protein [Postia placenta Mad-698-R]OSX64810.1 hypothetical protein POSPLADRAFT_1044259 [Postia placenta MAD-698-R-SB12]